MNNWYHLCRLDGMVRDGQAEGCDLCGWKVPGLMPTPSPSKAPALPPEVWATRRDADYMAAVRAMCGEAR